MKARRGSSKGKPGKAVLALKQSDIQAAEALYYKQEGRDANEILSKALQDHILGMGGRDAVGPSLQDGEIIFSLTGKPNLNITIRMKLDYNGPIALLEEKQMVPLRFDANRDVQSAVQVVSKLMFNRVPQMLRTMLWDIPLKYDQMSLSSMSFERYFTSVEYNWTTTNVAGLNLAALLAAALRNCSERVLTEVQPLIEEAFDRKLPGVEPYNSITAVVTPDFAVSVTMRAQIKGVPGFVASVSRTRNRVFREIRERSETAIVGYLETVIRELALDAAPHIVDRLEDALERANRYARQSKLVSGMTRAEQALARLFCGHTKGSGFTAEEAWAAVGSSLDIVEEAVPEYLERLYNKVVDGDQGKQRFIKRYTEMKDGQVVYRYFPGPYMKVRLPNEVVSRFYTFEEAAQLKPGAVRRQFLQMARSAATPEERWEAFRILEGYLPHGVAAAFAFSESGREFFSKFEGDDALYVQFFLDGLRPGSMDLADELESSSMQDLEITEGVNNDNDECE